MKRPTEIDPTNVAAYEYQLDCEHSEWSRDGVPLRDNVFCPGCGSFVSCFVRERE